MSDRRVRRGCAAVLILIGAVLASTVAWGLAGAPSSTVASGFDVGTVVPAALATARGTDATLFVFLRRDCPASRRMAAWLPELATGLTGRAIHTVAVFPEDGGADEVAFARSVGITPDTTASVRFADLPLVAVPAFVLIDGDGVVRAERAGAIDGADREAFLATLDVHRR